MKYVTKDGEVLHVLEYHEDGSPVRFVEQTPDGSLFLHVYGQDPRELSIEEAAELAGAAVEHPNPSPLP